MTQITKEILEEILEKKLDEKLSPIVQTVNDLKDSMQFLSDKYDSVNNRVDELESKYNLVQQENKFLKAEILKLSKVGDDLAKNVDAMNQYGRRDCSEISGLPVEPHEDTNQLVIRVANLMGVHIDESDISVSHRLPISNNLDSNRARSPALNIPKVIVKFVRREKKEQFYKGRKNLKNKTTKDLKLARLSENNIYVSESLSPRNNELFKACLQFRRDNAFKFIWTQQGRIYLRKNNDTPARLIATRHDLENLIPSR
ncbi:uncharacterized protein LOC114535474 [Dendronephthya gigantea]|uniref:uncharacterized protein LOC114535474 n=1 Tax=Dendronephthya gigantea TaxID=151771 RepID=UPI001069D26C|nr:uncharacterized protein LOC114535474 [Dendronephthya gigantea]